MVEASGVDGYRLKGPGLEGPGFAIVESAARSMVEHDMVEIGESDLILVAVSGGPDSVCLLDVLLRLRSTFNLELEVAHVDHGLSDESARIAGRVAAHAAEEGLQVHVAKAPDLAGPNLQARARDFRYAFFTEIVRQQGGMSVATGHTLDDRVETALARLIHGAAPEGLVGLLPSDHQGVTTRIRPLIALRRAETRTYCIERGLEFFDDPANEDEHFERVAVRKRVLAAIEKRWGEGAVRAIARSLDRLLEDVDALRFEADLLFERHVDETAYEDRKALRWDLSVLRSASRAIQRRVLALSVGPIRDRYAGIDEVMDWLSRNETGAARFDLAEGVTIVIDFDALYVLRFDAPD